MNTTIINAPTSTKRRGWKHAPDLYSTRKENQNCYGMKVHVSLDWKNRTVHSLVTTPANVYDS